MRTKGQTLKNNQFFILLKLSFGQILISLGRPIYRLLYLLTKLILFSIKFLGNLIISFAHLLNKLSFKPPSFRLPYFKFPSLYFSLKPLTTPFIYFIFLSTFISSFFYFWIIRDLPNPNKLKTNPVSQTTQIFDRNGILLYRIYEDENRTLVKLEDIPLFVRQATISIEDKDFYTHQGFSLRGIFRAISRNFTHNEMQGGSTITQQLIKNTLLTREKTISRKIKEIILSIQTELLFSKDEILQMYLNQVAYGGTAYGIQAAAQQYFGKNVSDLNLAQAALLAGLPQAPTKYSPFGENSKLAKSRQLTVLRRMYEDGYLSQTEYQNTSSQDLNFISPAIGIKAPHFVMYVKDLLVNQFGEYQVSHGGLQIHTSLDLQIQEKAEKILNEQIKSLQHFHVTNAAILITNPKTGEILSMVGSKDYFDVDHDGQVNLTTALRQPGSAIKPINYALAFEKGLTPSTTIEDSPVTFYSPGSQPWSPQNYDNRFHGLVTLRTALGSSYNIPAVKLLAQNGIPSLISLAQKMGLTTLNDPSRFGLSLTLGSAEVKMTDMAEVYGTFANLGQHVKLNPFLSVYDSNQKALNVITCTNDNQLTPLAQATDQCFPQPVISPQTAYLISDILSDNQARTPAFGANSILKTTPPIAVKTGTSNNLRDNWTIGYTPDFVVAVWVGNNDNSPMSSIASGITGASPIWAEITNELLHTFPFHSYAVPENIVKVTICGLTNTLSCPTCPNPKTEIYLNGTQPTATCNQEQIEKILEAKNNPILTGLTTSR